MKVKKIITIILIIMILLIAVYSLTSYIADLQKKRAIEFKQKWKPICEELGGLYLEEGLNQKNDCYVNLSGILVRTMIIESQTGNYLRGDCFIIPKQTKEVKND